MNTDNNESIIGENVRPVCDNTIGGPAPYEDWSKEDLIKQLRQADAVVEGFGTVREDYEERIMAAVDLGSEISDKLEKIKGRTFDEWLKGWVDDQVAERVSVEVSNLQKVQGWKLDVSDITGLADKIHMISLVHVQEEMKKLSASDIYGLETLVQTQADDVFDDRIKEISVEVEAQIVY